jgi:hypothetical protein
MREEKEKDKEIKNSENLEKGGSILENFRNKCTVTETAKKKHLCSIG